MTTNSLVRGLGAVALLAVWGCQTLDVTNPNDPDRARALKDPLAVEALTKGAFQSWFNAYTDLRGSGVTNVQARTFSSSWNNGNLNYHQGIYLADGTRMNPADTTVDPLTWTRNGAPYANDPSNSARTTIEALWGGGLDESAILRPGMYAVLNSANLTLAAIRQNNLLISDAATTKRDETMAVLAQGLALMTLSLQYDKAYIIDESTDLTQPLDYSTRDVVRDSAVSKLLQAASMAENNTFPDVPSDWTNGFGSYSKDGVAKIAYTAAAMTLAWYARDSVEAANNVDWTKVQQYAQKGLLYSGCTTPAGCPGDFQAVGDGYNAWVSELGYWFDGMDGGRVHTRVAHFMDPATQIDPYRLGIGSPQPNSPDKRLGDGSFAPFNLGGSYNNVPKTANGGTDFAWLGTGEIFRSDRGYYAQSNMGQMRYDESGEQDCDGYIYCGYGPIPTINWELNELLLAQADLRLGGATNIADAVTHIDNTRVRRGGLASSVAFAANVGVPGDGPCMTNNKLAKDGSACSLWSALLYENELELLALGPAPYWNQRGLPNVVASNWEPTHPAGSIYNGARYIQGLLPGTPREMPVPAKELGVHGEALYTWGGTGAANSATP